MISRRGFLRYGSVTGASVLLLNNLTACGGGGGDSPPLPPATSAPSGPTPISTPATQQQWLMPDESASHRATWMAFVAAEAIWGRKLSGPVLDTLVQIANAIVQFEPVKMLVRAQDMPLARQKFDPRVQLITQDLDDLWLRDSGPVFVRSANGDRAAINFNFNGWGNKQAHSQDRLLAAAVSHQAGVGLLNSRLTLEGGAIEVDGQGTAILTESCILNNNRNPNVSKADCEAELLRVLGVRKVIWLPGIAGKDITDGHTDFYARFVRPGVVLAAYDGDPSSYDHAVTLRHLDILRAATDADGRALKIHVLDAPTQTRPQYSSTDFAAGYINYYVCNGAIIAPEFGDNVADAKAKTLLASLFPERTIIQLNIDPLAAGGGGIHCCTQQEI